MYQFLYFTDSQADDRPLSFRRDDFGNTILNKFQEIINVANSHMIDIYCGGDFLDRPYITYPFLNRMFMMFRGLNTNFYLVLGNHDIVGRNLESYERSALGILENTGVIKILKDPIVKEGFKIQSIPFNEDHQIGLYDNSERTIIISHNMIVPDPVPFEHTHPIEITPRIQDKGSLVLSGHSHVPFDLTLPDGLRFINPGSLGRVSREPKEAERTPKFLFITLRDGSYRVEYIPVSCAPHFSTTFKAREEDKPFSILDLSDLKNIIHSTKAQAFSISEYVKKVASDRNINKDILEESLKRISEAETGFKLTPDY